MEKVEAYLKNMPTEIIDFMSKQDKFTSFGNYLLQVQEDLESFKKYGSFPATSKNGMEANNITNKTKLLTETALKESNYNSLQIKQERISEIHTNGVDSEHRNSMKENIKTEKPDMPPPQLPVKKNRKPNKESAVQPARQTRSKSSKIGSLDKNSNRDSDVILQQEKVETISIKDSDDENQLNLYSNETTVDRSVRGATRTTRSKRKAKGKNQAEDKGKRSRSPSTDIENSKKVIKQTVCKISEEQSETELSSYEDADGSEQAIASNEIPQQVLNETYVTQKVNKETEESKILNQTTVIQKDLVNTTITLEKPTSNNLSNGTGKAPTQSISDIMTDDEDDHITVTLPKQITKPIKKGTKQIFSPFEGSPVRKRVEAFEKFGAEAASDIPIRTTRTRTKPKPKNNEEEESAIPKQSQRLQLKEKKDARLTPQMQTRYLPPNSYSASKAVKPFMNESLISTKSASALKASQQEFKERELKRRQKEVEAIKKREALLQMQMEEKRRKREEKQIKAQQQREALEKSKQKEREQAEKTKEEKYRQALTEKQEKLKKQQEEVERRRLEAMKKAMEEKHKEEERKREVEENEKHMKEKLKQEELKKALEERRLAKYAEKKKVRNLPIYLRQKTPLLPTVDCYDSDDEEAGKIKVRTPAWMSRENMASSLRTMQFMDTFAQNFFILNVTTPDLVDIFESIDPRKLKRTSSAVWRAPPRFTMMPNTIEESLEEDY